MLSSDHLARLAAVGITTEQLVVVTAVIEEVTSHVTSQQRDAQRHRDVTRAKTAERTRRWRKRCDVTVTSQGGRGVISPSGKISQEEKEKEGLPVTDARGAKVDKSDEVDRFAAAWNELAAELGLAKVARVTPDRRAKAKLRLAEIGGLDALIETVWPRIRASPGLQGKVDGGWRCSFDFLLQPSSFTKLIEGTYDNWKERTNGRRYNEARGNAAMAQVRSLLEERARRTTEGE